MELPIKIKNNIEELASKYKLNDLKATANKLSETYLNSSDKNCSILNSEIKAITYAIMRMPATFASASSAIEKALEFYHDDIHSVLDIGAGVGTASLACSYLIKSDIKITAIEKEIETIKIGEILTNELNIDWIHGDFKDNLPENKYDLVIASYSLNELSNQDRIATFNKLLSLANKLLIIIEPGTPNASKQIKEYRDVAIKENYYIVAPCPHVNICPIKDDDWCHFVNRLSRSKTHRFIKDGEAPYEDEKYSYVAISKTKIEIPAIYRVMRHPNLKGNSIELVTCSKEGIKTELITKKDKDLFKQSKKLKTGDYIIK